MGERLHRFGGSQQFLHSCHANHSKASLDNIEWYNRNMPAHCMSTIAFIDTVCRYAVASPHDGGLRQSQSKEGANVLFLVLLRIACKRDVARSFTMLFHEDWQCAWPRPYGASLGPGLPVAELVLVVQPDCFLHVGGILCGQAELPTMQRNFRKRLAAGCPPGDNYSVPLVDVFKALVAEESLESLYAQLLWKVSKQLQGHLADLHCVRVVDADVEISIGEMGIKHGAKDMEFKLYQYVLSAVAESKRHNVFSLATDAVSVPSTGHVLNTFLTFGNNRTAFLVLMVANWGKQ